jgi:disulfide bond formation protein DsbB
MFPGGISSYVIPLGRTLAGFIAALLLAFLGDITARVFNLAIGYPWSLPVHQNIHLIGIGVGAGIGAYLGRMSLGLRWYWMLGWTALVLAGGLPGLTWAVSMSPELTLPTDGAGSPPTLPFISAPQQSVQ